MRIYILYVAVVTTLLSTVVTAQTKSASSSKGAPPDKPLTEKTDSLKIAANDLKTTINNFFPSKRDTVTILISNIDYDDANLSLLKENLKKLKGVRSVEMQYKAATAILEVSFRGKSTDLWDKLPADAKEPFKITEADDNSLQLKFKDVKPAQ